MRGGALTGAVQSGCRGRCFACVWCVSFGERFGATEMWGVEFPTVDGRWGACGCSPGGPDRAVMVPWCCEWSRVWGDFRGEYVGVLGWPVDGGGEVVHANRYGGDVGGRWGREDEVRWVVLARPGECGEVEWVGGAGACCKDGPVAACYVLPGGEGGFVFVSFYGRVSSTDVRSVGCEHGGR